MPVPSDPNLPIAIGPAATLAVCLAVIATMRWHGRLSRDGTTGPQKFHIRATPRIGGLAVYAGYWAAAAAAAEPLRSLLFAVGASAVFAFLAGFAEDVTKSGRLTLRVGGPMLSALTFCLLSGYAVDRVAVPLIDDALAVPLIAVAFTTLTVGSLPHALNMIDGFHGLAAGTAIIILAAFAVLAGQAGDRDMVLFCLIAGGVLTGFLLANFPFGLIFLGDGGAYLLGLVLGTVSVLVPMRNPEISPWTSTAVLAYPLCEIIFSVIRKVRVGRDPCVPDRLHLHMLVRRRFRRAITNAGGNRQWANPVTGAVMWAWPSIGLASVLLLPPDRKSSLAVLIATAALYVALHRRLLRR